MQSRSHRTSLIPQTNKCAQGSVSRVELEERVPNEPREGFVTAQDGTKIYWCARGSGPPLMMFDGIGCDGFAWRYLLPHLAQTHRVIHWHYRGHGRSGLPADPSKVEIPVLAEDAVTVFEHVGAGRAVLIGHSMGTQVALEFYRSQPESVEALILCCGSYGQVTSHFHNSDRLKHALPTIIKAVDHHLGIARAIWGRVPAGLAYRIARLSGEVDRFAIREDDFRAYWSHVASMGPKLFLSMLECAGEHSAEDLLEQINVPTLVIAAERDTFSPPERAQRMASLIPNSELTMIPEGSHAAVVEQPDTVRRHIDRFLLERLGRVSGDFADQ